VGDQLELLRRCCASRYDVEQIVGQGGMATVYRARDLRHERTVAIKVLRPELAASLGPERFLREIRITAQLDHPHVLPLLDSGSAEGLLYYVMPFVDGESVRDRLMRDGPLPVVEAVRIAREVADALDHAHAHGIVHRDIKPENVLLANRHARVADFGIARAVSSAGTGLTDVGLAVGTPQYMSPEVASGEQADARSDIYQLGCLLYEMLVGEPPFVGPTAQAVLAMHVTRAVPSAGARRRDLPPAVDAVIRKAMGKAPGDRWSSGAAFAAALGGEGATPAFGRRRWMVWGAALVAVAAGVAVVIARRGGGEPDALRVAVLPRATAGEETAGGEEAAGYLEEGLAEAVGIELMRLQGVTVVAHESARRLEHDDPRSAVRALKVDDIVLLSARRGAGTLHVTVRLVDARGDQRWAEQYDRPLEVADIVEVQRDVARNVARSLGGFLAPLRIAPAGDAPTADFGAYNVFMRGRYFWKRRGADNLVRAAQDLERAVALDPSFAEGYIALAQTYLLFPVYGVRELPADSALARAESLVEAGLALDASLGEGHAARALLLELRHHDWPAARRAFEQALALAPGAATVHQWFGEHLLVGREIEAALRALQQATALDPLSPAVNNALAIGLHVAGDHQGAIAQVARTVAVDSSYREAHFVSAAAFLSLGQLDSVAAALARAGMPEAAVTTIVATLRGVAPSSAGVGAVRALEGHLGLGAIAALYAAVGAHDDALRAMERALASPGEDLTITFAPLPVFRDVMADPRYRIMLASLGVTVPPPGTAE
jgi:serine/threonine-protein kinase